MNINTAATNRSGWHHQHGLDDSATKPRTTFTLRAVLFAGGRFLLVWILLLAAGILSARASTVLGPWVPVFKGIDHAVGTNTPGGGGFSVLQVAHVMRVDLTDPDIQLFSTPRIADYVADSRETVVHTVSQFLTEYHLQVAINANEYHPSDNILPAGTPMDIYGLSICQGELVSPDYRKDCASVMFTTNNAATMVYSNWPPVSTEGIYTAVSGIYPVLSNNVNLGARYGHSDIHGLEPRTAFGLSQDRRYLYLMTIDGRQSGYSNGAYDSDTAGWLLLAGASDGVNMDGGGSTTLVIEDATGQPERLNIPSTIPGLGRERTIGSHFGIFAKPVPGFINDLQVVSGDESAVISWTTSEPATTQVEFGPTAALGSATALQPDLVTNHVATLAGLALNTGYYYRAVSTVGSSPYYSPIKPFFTQLHRIFDLTNLWSYRTANLDGVNWTVPGYDDTGWEGSGPGLLWVDISSSGPNEDVQPKNTQMPANPNNGGYPYTTYYFRTHFPFTDSLAGVSLTASNYLDDGAVFYLNGTEIQRLYMAAAPAVILNATLAAAYGCDGNATCPTVFTLSADASTNLVAGDNVLAVEVHNYNVRSPDITFGMALSYAKPESKIAKLSTALSGGLLTLSWDQSGFSLEQADAPTGPWTAVAGPFYQDSFTTSAAGQARYYRLRK